MYRPVLFLFAVLSAWKLTTLCTTTLGQETDWFESQIRPLLAEKCWDCHAETKQWGGLRLDSRAGILQGGDSGPAANLEELEKSELLRRIISEDPEVRMPPPEKNQPLSAVQVDHLKQWLKLGAPWPESLPANKRPMAQIAREHWAFQPLQFTPSILTPTAQNVTAQNVTAQNTSHWIDTHIDHSLKTTGLTANEQADRRTELRRLSMALTGLYPSHDEVESYVNDPQPDAWDRRVQAMLASMPFAEKWARLWMDIARYSDTKGYVYGREERTFVHSRAYRDWLIKAFAEDVPYDQFVRMQLAADQLVPDGDPDLAALGFLTLGRRFLAIQYDIIDDRLDTVFRGIMGLTVQCARCHDHKYDPITAKDYYSLSGIFQSCIDERVELPSRMQQHSPEFRQGLAERKAKLKELTLKHRNEANDRIQKRFADYLETQVELEKYPEGNFNQLSTKDDLIPALVHRWEWYLALPEIASHPVIRPWTELSALPREDFANQAKAWLATVDSQNLPIDPRVREALEPAPNSHRDLADRYGKLVEAIDKEWKEEVERRTASEGKSPESSNQPILEPLRALLLDRNSGFYIPDEPIDSTEWYWDNGTCVEIWKAQLDVDQWLIQAPEPVAELAILRDRNLVSDARLLKRGNANKKGELVRRGYFEHLAHTDQEPSPKEFTHGSGRLELADLIVSPKNPLTARVWVNRVWQQIFGAGLVQSTSDFGTRCDPPSHPELLDRLAHEFIEHGWSTRWLIREMVCTSAFRRASFSSNRDALEKDPENRLLWRANRRRLTWEETRDLLIASSGAMIAKVGGKSVDPLGVNSESLARRSLYSIIDRQYLPMTLQNFDFANPDMHNPKRSETLIPQQALFLLNHPMPAQAAKLLVENIQRDYPMRNDLEDVQHVFQRILQRSATEDESRMAIEFLHEAVLNVPQDSAPSTNTLTPLAQLAHLLLLSNETFYVD